MAAISKIIKDAMTDLQQARMFTEPQFMHVDIAFEDFKKLLQIECEKIMVERHQTGYLIDKQNLPVIEHFHRYLIGRDFKGDIQKGIMVFGAYGIGKSILMRGFAKVIERLTNKVIRFISAYNLSREIVANGMDEYKKRPLLIDDLGKEQDVVKDYGTEVRPLMELFAERYDNAALNFVTTNYNMITLKEKYGAQNADRFMEIFNFILMEGKSRRDGTTVKFKVN